MPSVYAHAAAASHEALPSSTPVLCISSPLHQKLPDFLSCADISHSCIRTPLLHVPPSNTPPPALPTYHLLHRLPAADAPPRTGREAAEWTAVLCIADSTAAAVLASQVSSLCCFRATDSLPWFITHSITYRLMTLMLINSTDTDIIPCSCAASGPLTACHNIMDYIASVTANMIINTHAH